MCVSHVGLDHVPHRPLLSQEQEEEVTGGHPVATLMSRLVNIQRNKY